MDALDDIKSKGRQGKAVINMSFVYELNNKLPDRFFRLFRDLLQKLDAENVVLVAAAGNDAYKKDKNGKIELDEGILVNKYPAKFADPSDKHGGLLNLIVVSASNFKTQSGCNVKKLIQHFARRIAVRYHPVATEDMRPVIWNGQVGEHSCLSEYAAKGKEDWVNIYPTIKNDLADELPNQGESVGSCSSGQTGSSAKRLRQSAGDGGGSCPHVPGSSGPGKTIVWEEGPSAPECAADDHCGGELCKGYHCDPDPEIPHPPDYYDPKDPENPHNQPAPPLEEPEPTSTTTSTPPTETPDPPVDTVVVCVGRTIEALWVNAPCSGGKDIGIGSINNFLEICDIADNKETTDICDFEMTFINRGPEFWGKYSF
ncbi:hypothetical protein FE257_001309 [Aspergillus nanangensis]|uniref:Peptidase S8/S53 domain-containing protein n=1 Tax=Aspergillus nanangensis TaxID=2582783 RepID=A0AAD4CFK0_ASPNN|nr:hypothetical protein FE257_001309 [Aspergillus nanangensis]